MSRSRKHDVFAVSMEKDITMQAKGEKEGLKVEKEAKKWAEYNSGKGRFLQKI
ncbi:hypothetical protein ACFVP8_07960 [Viridibacillus arvi]|uniref:hypothetical protein n=1 Tax=Viridibacillus arvi TaxID=263475 RepID=UPI0036CFBCB8